MTPNGWVGLVREVLYPPTEVAIAALDRLAAALGPDAPDRLRADADGMRRRGVRLRELVVGRHGDPSDPDARRLRHDLRTEPAAVVMLCDLWELRAAKGLAAVPRAELAAARRAAQQVIDLVATFRDGFDPRSLPAAGGHVSAAPGRVLVVDDDPANRELVREALAGGGHRLTEAGGGPEALDLLTREPFDVALLDLFMPGMSGYEVLVRMRLNPALAHVPAIMVSALDESRMAAAAIAAGADDYLPRPFSPVVLQARVAAGLERKRLRDRDHESRQQIDRLLHALFPPEIVDRLRADGDLPPRRHDPVGVLFLDVVGFTRFCETHAREPERVVGLLQDLVTRLEAVARRHGVQKIKTIGDAFLATAGLTRPDPNPARTLVACGLDMIAAVADHPAGWRVRVGVHVGPVMAGKIGDTQFQYDVWGSTVNLAARLQGAAAVGGITLTAAVLAEAGGGWEAAVRTADIDGVGPVAVADVFPPPAS